MKAVVLKSFGSSDNLVLEEIPRPEIKDNEVLIKTRAFSINPVDYKTRIGKSLADSLKNENPLILGWDISGEIVETGRKVSRFKKGDEVFGMVNFPEHGKAYAEYVAVSEDQLVLKPVNISHSEATAACLAALTAWQALLTHAKIRTGQRILIHAAAGGVGHFAVQIAKHFGAYVIGTASSSNREFVLSLGADEHIDYKEKPFEEQLTDIDLVLDAIGGEIADRSLKVIRKGGMIITFPSGQKEDISEKAAAKGVNGLFIVVAINLNDLQQIADLMAKGIIRSHVSQEFKIDQLSEAHRQIESGRTTGKIVVTL